MKNLILGVILASSLPFSAAIGKEGSGVRGGGNVIEVNGKLELVDLVTTATCDWISGQEMMDSNPAIAKILSKVEKLDWYLALELEREIRYLSWCLTGKLYSVPVSDNDSFVQQLTKGVQQAAFRYNESAYIDQQIFNRLSQNSKAYLILHETLHSYLPMHLEMRKFKLMSLVATFNKVEKDQIRTREALHLNLQKNEMDFPLTVKKLNSFKNSLQFIFATEEKKAKAVLASTAPEKLIAANTSNAEAYVAEWDKESVRSPMNSLVNTIKFILLNQDVQAARKILQDQKYESLNPASIGLSIYEDLTEEVQAEVLASPYINLISEDAIKFFEGIEVSIENSRILSDLKLQSLSKQCIEKNPQYLTSLSPGMSCELPKELEGLAAFITLMLHTQNLDVLEANVLSNQDLISALKMETFFRKLALLEAPIAREKPLALQVAKEIQKMMKVQFAQSIEAKVSPTSFKVIKPFLNQI